jgi:hypothetical protein
MLLDAKTYPTLIRVTLRELKALPFTNYTKKPILKPRHLAVMTLLEHIKATSNNVHGYFLYDDLNYPMSIKMLNILSAVFDPKDTIGIFDNRSNAEVIGATQWKKM